MWKTVSRNFNVMTRRCTLLSCPQSKRRKKDIQKAVVVGQDDDNKNKRSGENKNVGDIWQRSVAFKTVKKNGQK